MADKAKNKSTASSSAKQSSSSGKNASQPKQTKSSKASKSTPKKPNIIQRFIAYLKNVRQEIKRTSWPGRGEVLRMSSIVIGALLFFGIIIFSLDSIMTRFIAFYAQFAPAASEAGADSIYDLLGAVIDNLPLLMD